MLGACVGAGSFGGAGCVVRGIIVVLEMGGGVWFGLVGMMTELVVEIMMVR